MNLNMRFPLSKSSQTTPKFLRHVFYIMYHKNYYQAYWKVNFFNFQPPYCTCQLLCENIDGTIMKLLWCNISHFFHIYFNFDSLLIFYLSNPTIYGNKKSSVVDEKITPSTISKFTFSLSFFNHYPKQLEGILYRLCFEVLLQHV